METDLGDHVNIQGNYAIMLLVYRRCKCMFKLHAQLLYMSDTVSY